MYLENGWPIAGLGWPWPKPTRSLILGQVSQGLFSWREGPERTEVCETSCALGYEVTKHHSHHRLAAKMSHKSSSDERWGEWTPLFDGRGCKAHCKRVEIRGHFFSILHNQIVNSEPALETQANTQRPPAPAPLLKSVQVILGK